VKNSERVKIICDQIAEVQAVKHIPSLVYDKRVVGELNTELDQLYGQNSYKI